MLRFAFALFALFAAFTVAAPAAAQVQRAFPQNALRGTVIVGETPELLLNGRPARLAPGSRIRDMNNMGVVPSAALGGRFVVNYTIEDSGLVKDIWILRPEEAAMRPWPSTPEEARSWSFDPAAQVWTRP